MACAGKATRVRVKRADTAGCEHTNCEEAQMRDTSASSNDGAVNAVQHAMSER